MAIPKHLKPMSNKDLDELRAKVITRLGGGGVYCNAEEIAQLILRLDNAETFVEDVAVNGLRCDTNPTVVMKNH